MSIEFQIQGKTTRVTCYRSLNLLAHAQIEDLDIGSQCGGHGICGGDRILVQTERKNLSELTEAELRLLKPEEIQAGYRLACQCWPSEDDLEISVVNCSTS